MKVLRTPDMQRAEARWGRTLEEVVTEYITARVSRNTAAKRLGVSSTTLRYWEQKLKPVISGVRFDGGE